MQEWLNQPMHTLGDMEKLHSKLLHICLVIPMGQAYLWTGVHAQDFP